MARLAGYGGDVLVGAQVIENCNEVWDEQVDADVVASLDDTDYKVGGGSVKLECAAGLAVGDIIASQDISSLDLSGFTRIMFWLKSSVDLAEGDLQLQLDDTASLASPVVTLDVPALTAGVWKLCSVSADLSSATAIISVGLKLADNDPGAFDIHVDDIRAAASVAGIKSWAMDYTFSTTDVTGFDSAGAKEFSPTSQEWAGTFEGFKDGAPLTIGTIVSLELRESSVSTQQWRGSAILTGIHPSVAIDNMVMYNYDFQGTGQLTQPAS